MTPENKEHFQSENEAIFLLLTGIGDEIYSTIDACKIANEMWIAIERLQQGESLNVQDVKTNLFWEFGKFTSRDGESMESYPGSRVKLKSCPECRFTSNCFRVREVLPEESSSTDQPLEQVQNNDENNVFANERRHSEQPESINDTYVLEKDDSNVTPNSSNICNNDNQVDQNAAGYVDERAALANLIVNLTLETEENKMILKQLKKANASLTQELKECRTNLDETSRALGEATSCRDSCLIALQNKQNELEKYIAFNDRTIDYDILQTKLNETLGLLARKDIDIKEGLKTKAYEISVVNQKHDELVKRSLLTKSQFEGQLKEKSKVILDLKVKEEKDIDKMIEMDKQLKFLNEIVYTRNQSIQTIHMLAPKCSTYNGRPTFANPRYLKKAQSEKPCLYEIPYDTSDLANRFAPNREETMTLANESRSKLNKDYVKPYDYTKHMFMKFSKGTLMEYLYQFERAKEVRKTMWRTTVCFEEHNQNIAKNVFAFLPFQNSLVKILENVNARPTEPREIYMFCEEIFRGNDLLTASPIKHGLCIEDFFILTSITSPLLSKKDVMKVIVDNVKDNFVVSCEMSKAKKKPHLSQKCSSSKGRLNFVHRDLCGPMRSTILEQGHPMLISKNEAIEHKTSNLEHLKIGRLSKAEPYEGYRVYNKRTRLIVESIHIKFDEIKEMMSDHNNSDLAPQRQEMSVENVSSGLVPQDKKGVRDYGNLTRFAPDKMLFLRRKRQIRHKQEEQKDEDQVYVAHQKGFVDQLSRQILPSVESLYGLASSRAWYDELSTSDVKGFIKVQLDPTLFKIKSGEDNSTCEISVDA
ncbi:hypothetical protein Tco_0345823 [Tanacetum coccineum]